MKTFPGTNAHVKVYVFYVISILVHLLAFAVMSATEFGADTPVEKTIAIGIVLVVTAVAGCLYWFKYQKDFQQVSDAPIA